MSAIVMFGMRCGGQVVGGRSARPFRALALGAVVAGMLMVVAVAPAVAADFTWSPDSSAKGSADAPAHWSTGSNWVGGAAPSGNVGTLTFPAESCGPDLRPRDTTTTSQQPVCPIADADVPGLTATNLKLIEPNPNPPPPVFPWGLGVEQRIGAE